MQRRAKALEHLPGPTPKYWLPGFMGLIVRKDPHRYSTVLAERFGPIYKFRVLCFHVRLIALPFDHPIALVKQVFHASFFRRYAKA